MCHKTEVLSQTKNGLLVSCPSYGIYHLTFGHFYLELTEKELVHFRTFINEIDVEYWDNKYCSSTVKRKIPIPTQQLNLYLMFNRTELEELKSLVFYKERPKNTHLLQVDDVDYDFIKN